MVVSGQWESVFQEGESSGSSDAERSRKKRLNMAILFKTEVIGGLIKDCFTEMVE